MKIDPTKINISSRQRKDYGDISGLKQSIQSLGQLNPIIIDENNNLIAGGRRLAACLELGIDVEVTYFKNLSFLQTYLIELAENLKRKELSWQEQVDAIISIYKLIKETHPEWPLEKIANEIGIAKSHLYNVLSVGKYIETKDERVINATGFSSARHIAAKLNQRQVDKELSTINDDLLPSTEETIPDDPDPIIETDFFQWVENYSGPKFNFIHCDFPQEDNFQSFCQVLVTYKKKLLTPKSQIMLWFPIKDYHWAKTFFLSNGFDTYDEPLIWHKTDNKSEDTGHRPRNIYETAFIFSLGGKEIIQPIVNVYGCPTTKLGEKPEPMLRHFFKMFVDDYAEILDPTAGTGSSIRAAKSLHAKRVVGLEQNQESVKEANKIYHQNQRKAALSDNHS